MTKDPITYYYHISYDEKRDEFFAFVDNGTKAGQCVFQINDTKEVCSYIKSGKMKHIDDVDGLGDFLKEQEILAPNDCLLLCEELLW